MPTFITKCHFLHAPVFLWVFIFQNLQAPKRLCKFGPMCQNPRCQFDHPPPHLPLLEYELAPQGYNIQPTDTDHVQEVRWPISCKMYDVFEDFFLFSVNLQDVLEAAETERGVYSSIPTKANQANPKERSRALRKINPNPKI